MSNFRSPVTPTLQHPPPYNSVPHHPRASSYRSNHRALPYNPHRKPSPGEEKALEADRHKPLGLDSGMQSLSPGQGQAQGQEEDVKLGLGEHDGVPRPSSSPMLPAGSTPVPGPKKRRRIHLNCEECRRTKSRCNRSWPCSECVKKGLAHICPNQVSKVSQPKSQTIADLTDRVKVLEDVLRRNGLDAEIPLSLPSPELATTTRPVQPPVNVDEHSRSRAWDMTAMLGELTSSTQSKGYAGTEGSAFYLSSPDGTESDRETDNDRSGLAEFPTPWTRRAGEHWKDASSSQSLNARCRAMLPTPEQAQAMFEHFWEATAWRIQPMTRTYFMQKIMCGIYESEGAHPHELAVLFATKAMSELFRPTTGSPYAPQDYHEMSYACLVAGRFYTETTTASLISLHLLANFFINSDDRKMVDAIFAIIGMAMRLAVIAGYHRDVPYHHLPQEELDQRRRIWYELLAVERVHCLPSLLPGSISSSHYDVSFPSDAHPDGYFVCKWRLGRYMSRVIDCWTARTAPASAAIQTIDAGLRRLFHSIPQHLTCNIMPIDAYSLSDSHRESDTNGHRPSMDSDSRPSLAPPPVDISDGSPPGQVDIQQIRLAQHFVMVFFYLHRPSFMQILAKGGDMQSLSVRTMLETCRHMVLLLKTAMSRDHATVSRWFGFAADLFTTLHCPTALIVKTTDRALASQQMSLLEEGALVIEWIAISRPSSKNRALAAGTRRLVATARTRYLDFGSVNVDQIPPPIAPGHAPVGRIPSFSEMLHGQIPQKQAVNPTLAASRNDNWTMEFPHIQASVPGSSHSSNNPMDWTGFPFMPNAGPALPQPQHPSHSTGAPQMQTMSSGQISPMDLTLPMTSPLTTTNAHLANPIHFGHLPMIPNQMDNWPMSMQNLGAAPAPDPYAPSSEGFDMWLSSILSDGNGSGGQGQGIGP